MQVGQRQKFREKVSALHSLVNFSKCVFLLSSYIDKNDNYTL